MDNKRFENLYEAFNSYVQFNEYMKNNELTKVSEINFDLLKMMFSSFYLTTLLDPLIEKNYNGEIKIKLNKTYINELVKCVAKPNKNGYTIGELSYKNAEVTLDKIRNKLAHGDYIVENENIIFEENNHRGIIKVNKLVGMIMNLENDLSKYILAEESVKIYGICKYVRNKKINGIASFKKYCKDLLVLIIKDEPLEGYFRNDNYIYFVEKMQNKIVQLFEKNELNDCKIKEYIKINKNKMEFLGIKIDYEIKSVYELEIYNGLLEEYKNNPEIIETYNNEKLPDYLFNRILKLSKGKYQKFNYLKGINLNLLVIDKLNNNSTLTYENIKKMHSDLKFIFTVDSENILIANVLSGFYSFYQYGLEKGLTKKGSYDLSKIVENESLDFSKLDISLLDDPNMIIEHQFLNYKTDIQKYKINQDHILKTIKKHRENLLLYLKHTPQEKQEEKRISTLNNIIEELINQYKKNEELIKKQRIFY